jgi:hypothetical protein
MATTFKTFLNNDITSTKTLLHEAIPVTGTIVSGTYSDNNIKNYAHGMFQSVYDYPYLSSSANHIFDLTIGYAASISGSNTQNAKKLNLYNQMAQVLVGHDATGSIREFDQDGDFLTTGDKITRPIFINFARLLSKDEVKKGSFTLKIFGTSSHTTAGYSGTPLTIQDTNAQNDYRVNSPAGEYGILSCSSGASSGTPACGLIFYQAGVAVLDGSAIFTTSSTVVAANSEMDAAGQSWDQITTGSAITASCDAIRNRLQEVSFNNTTELNSTIHFCRVNHNDFNYSANPTYLSQSKIRVKNSTTDAPVSYITTVGLYSADNELLAVAKLSEPLKKDPTNEMTIRVRLDY